MIIVKIGGGKAALDNLDNILKDFASIDERKILVHGANHEAKQVSEQLGHPPQMLTSKSGHVSRRTDRKTLEILEMVYSGVANKRIVEKLQSFGVNAVGLSGMDGRIWEGPRKKVIKAKVDGKLKIIRDDYTGKVEKVNKQLLALLLDFNYTPVLTIPGISYDNEAINLDNDRALAAMAPAIDCDKIVVLFEAPGLLRNKEDESSLVKELDKKKIDDAIKFTEGRMKKKMLGMKEAIDNGVKEIYFGDLRKENPITSALNGNGTVIR